MTEDVTNKREELMQRLNTVLDNYENSNEKMGYTMQIINLENLVMHMEKCWEFDMEFPSEEGVDHER